MSSNPQEAQMIKRCAGRPMCDIKNTQVGPTQEAQLVELKYTMNTVNFTEPILIK